MKKRKITVEITKEKYPWAPKEELGKYEIERWTWREKQDAVNASIEIIDAKRGIGQMDVTLYWAHVMRICIREKPKGLKFDADVEVKTDAVEVKTDADVEEKTDEVKLKAVKRIPSVERIYQLDPDVGDALRKACQEVCGLTTPEKAGFLELPGPDSDIPG